MLCAVSFLCAAALLLAPDGSGKRVLGFVCSVVILASVFRIAAKPDWEDYAMDSAKIRRREAELLQQYEDTRRELDRLVIAQEYGSYILHTAQQLHLPLQDAEVGVEWSLDGLWVPHDAVLIGDLPMEDREMLSQRILADLGIPQIRQVWRASEDDESDKDS